MNSKELRKQAEKEVKRASEIIDNVKVIGGKGEEIFEIAKSYKVDAEHFLKEGKFLLAFEAAVICWTYIDTGLHLNIFEITENLKRMFTIKYSNS